MRITVLGEFPETADLSAAKVDTRMVDPPAPPVVLWTIYNLIIVVGKPADSTHFPRAAYPTMGSLSLVVWTDKPSGSSGKPRGA